jgi:hypothetical protein
MVITDRKVHNSPSVGDIQCVCVLKLWLWEIGKGTSDVGSLCTRNVCSSDERDNVRVTVNCNCVNVYECAIMLR